MVRAAEHDAGERPWQASVIIAGPQVTDDQRVTSQSIIP
jgi:hypothetical protein